MHRAIAITVISFALTSGTCLDWGQAYASDYRPGVPVAVAPEAQATTAFGNDGLPDPGASGIVGQTTSSLPVLAPESDAPPGSFLQGSVTVVGAGTHFRATLSNTLDSGYNHPGEEFVALVTEPLISGGAEVIPVGSRLIGQITNVVSAKNFHFGTAGKIDVHFTSVETPDGRKFPLSASVDARQLRAAAGVTQSAAGNALRRTGHDAIKGAEYGAIGGAVFGALQRQTGYGGMIMPVYGAPMMYGLQRQSAFRGIIQKAAAGAVAGSVLGAGVGLVSSGVKKGAEVTVPAGTSLPIQLDQALTIPGRVQSPNNRTELSGSQAPQPANYPPRVDNLYTQRSVQQPSAVFSPSLTVPNGGQPGQTIDGGLYPESGL